MDFQVMHPRCVFNTRENMYNFLYYLFFILCIIIYVTKSPHKKVRHIHQRGETTS